MEAVKPTDRKNIAAVRPIDSSNPENIRNGDVSKEKSVHEGARMTRLEEKEALTHLNNRFANIIDRNRQLEHENQHLAAELKASETTISTVTASLKSTFEKETRELRRNLENVEKEKASLVISESNMRRKLKEAEDKLNTVEGDNRRLERELAETRAKNRKLEEELEKSRDAFNKLSKLKDELEDLLRRIRQENSELRHANEEHLVTIAELQAILKNKVDELKIKSEVHSKEIHAITSKSEVILKKIAEQVKKDYEKKLEDIIRKLRDEYQGKMDRYKTDQDRLHKMKESDYQFQIGKLQDSVKSKSEEYLSISAKIRETNSKLLTLEGERRSLEERVKGAELKLKVTEERLMNEIREMADQIRTLQEDKAKLIGEYQDLMGIKVALDNEIATYRILLEGEEDRLNILYEEAKKKESTKPTPGGGVRGGN